MTTMTAESYWLSTNCFACRSQGYWVLLSVDRDCYFGVLDEDLASIGPWLHGSQHRPRSSHLATGDAQGANALLETLRRRGIITQCASEGKPFAESDYLEATSSIDEQERTCSAGLSVPLILRFVLASARVDYLLRNRRLSQILPRVAALGKRISGAQLRAPKVDPGQISKLAATFQRLRPFYPRPYLCLFDSLALLEFLSRYRVSARVVFGVVAEPFEAHCWLQIGSMVLNDDLERVRRYKPILAI